MPVMTTRLSWGSKVSSCDAICSALRDGARRCWGRCRLVGTSDMTPAAQAIWRSIRPMVVQSLPAKLSALLSCTGWTFLRPWVAARRRSSRRSRPRVSRRKTREAVLGGLLLPLRRVIGLRGRPCSREANHMIAKESSQLQGNKQHSSKRRRRINHSKQLSQQRRTSTRNIDAKHRADRAQNSS